MSRIGILALQGGFELHSKILLELSHEVVEVRSSADLQLLDGIVLPGGESGVQLRLMARNHMFDEVKQFVLSGKPVFATCAGLILCAREVQNPQQISFGSLDIVVARNAWGAQIDSFEGVSDRGFPLVFIRAPRISSVGPKVEVLDTFQGEPILVREGSVTAATFHPEVSGLSSIHSSIF